MRFALCLCFLLFLVSSLAAQEPNESFATASSAGGLVVMDSLNGGGPHPDTLLAFFNDSDFLEISAIDDDSSPWGDGFASTIGPASILAGGDIYLGVTGTGDDTFLGNHTEQGRYYIQVDIFDANDDLIDQLAADDQLLEAGDSLFYDVGDPAWDGGSVVATIDNQLDMSGSDQYDYWRFSGLNPGVPFSAEITLGEFDSIIGWFDDGGALTRINDDGGDDRLSKLSGIVPDGGEVVIGVTGFNILGEEPFTDRHPQAGNYTLEVEEIDADFNNDENIDCSDIDALVTSLGSFSEEDRDVGFDLNGDGAVSQQDVADWLAAASTHAGPLLEGDANLDGFVDGSDFNILNDHRSSDAVQGWCQGNFNADANVDELDLDIWIANRFTSSDDQNAAASVPEPRGMVWMALALSMLICRMPTRRCE